MQPYAFVEKHLNKSSLVNCKALFTLCSKSENLGVLITQQMNSKWEIYKKENQKPGSDTPKAEGEVS